ncbi:type III secretion system cytoplasmic ring protein SctQ [Luteimonas sp. A534]
MATPERGARKATSRRTRTPATALPAAPGARPLRGLLPEVDAPNCEALRAFFAAPRWWLLGDGAAIQAEPANRATASFAVDAEGTRLRLHVEGPASAGVDDPRLRWSDHAGRARVLAWSLAHETTLRRLSEWLGSSLLPVLDDAGGDVPAPSLWLAVRIEDAPANDGGDAGAPPLAVTAHLCLPIAWLQAIAARGEPPHEDDPVPDAGRWRTLQAAVSLQFPTTLAMREWRALRPGDVIVAGHRGQPPTCIARAAGRDWPLAPAPGGWAVQGQPIPSPTFHEELSMSEAEQDGGVPPEAAPVADPARSLPVQLGFELGRTEMSIGELADLQPGYVFPLAAALEGSNVTIRANGRVAGRGELVAVGDTLGVRLLSWS